MEHSVGKKKSFIHMGTHLWSEVNLELQNVFDTTKVFVKV